MNNDQNFTPDMERNYLVDLYQVALKAVVKDGYFQFRWKDGPHIAITITKVFVDSMTTKNMYSVAQVVKDLYYDPLFDGQPGMRFLGRRFFSPDEKGFLDAVRSAHRRTEAPATGEGRFGSEGMRFAEVMEYLGNKLPIRTYQDAFDSLIEPVVKETLSTELTAAKLYSNTLTASLGELFNALDEVNEGNYSRFDVLAALGLPPNTPTHLRFKLKELKYVESAMGIKFNIFPEMMAPQPAPEPEPQLHQEPEVEAAAPVRVERRRTVREEPEVNMYPPARLTCCSSIVIDGEMPLIALAGQLAIDELTLVHEMNSRTGSRHSRLQTLTPKQVERYLKEYYPRIVIINREGHFTKRSATIIGRIED